jgi:hypothetical protein
MNASGRLVDPDGIATMILTLCLPQSRDINGAAVTIDGGTQRVSLDPQTSSPSISCGRSRTASRPSRSTGPSARTR